jgi:succinate-acetate transporter protein
MTTVLLNFVDNARLSPVDGMNLLMGIFYGGLAQIIAGVLEYKKGNTFGTNSFHIIWIILVILCSPKLSWNS